MKYKTLNKQKKLIKITQEETDPRCMRASIGGTPSVGYYLVFRGDNLDQMEEMLLEVYEAFKEANLKYKEQTN